MLRRILVLFAVCALTPLARAHDPFVAELRGDVAESTLTVRLTMARSVAAYLAGVNKAPRHYYAPASFSADKAAFEKAAATVCALEIGGKPLAPLRTTVDAGAIEEGDITFSLVYDRAKVASAAGKARLVGSWLSRLPVAESYASTFILRDGSTVLAGPSLLNPEAPAVEFVVAPAKSGTAD